ncbi:calcium-binding protein [Falsiroseomonas selenitidurans]|uniref:Calcium-binding protein n=1 Tax=Falsiroseomonas selenitidurans TaxID=2716335 RepID=A0ABX1EI24_9PROT|nr:hypothetical protein [Falsiroseomonas selenitidurans]NKC34510.1 hypothetical protein [Falsiroseomonas selenitidurans]
MTTPPKTLPAAALNRISGGVYDGFVEDQDGTAGADSLRGSGGRDMLFGHGGDDTLLGGSGNDALDGGAGADLMAGGAGDDLMEGGRGDGAADRLHGGEGSDRFFWQPGDGNDAFDGGDGRDTLWLTGVGMPGLLAGLQLDDPTVRMHVDGNQVSFTDIFGEPVGVSGSVTLGGERLTFASISFFTAPG